MINNSILEDYCSLEVSKLLKEKGCDVLCRYYIQEGKEQLHPTYARNSFFTSRIYVPSHALAIKWIRENFGIYIIVYPTWEDTSKPETFKITGEIWTISVDKRVNYIKEGYSPFFFDGVYAATDAALLYTLQNLIK